MRGTCLFRQQRESRRNRNETCGKLWVSTGRFERPNEHLQLLSARKHSPCSMYPSCGESYARMSLEDSLLPGAHETRNAPNVYRLARQRRVYATPNTGNHSGQPVWGTFVETTYSYLLSSSLAAPPLLSVFLSSGCAWIRVCSVTTEDWNKRELLFLEFAPSSILEFTSFCPFDFGVTNIRGHLRRLFPCFPSVWNRRTICCAWNISLSDTKVSLRWYHSSLPVICCNFYSRINLDDYVSI